ncbi:MAG: DUF2948 family protein [Paracoccaceae bacterium]
MRALLVVEDVLGVRTMGVTPGRSDEVLSILSLQWQPGEDGTGLVLVLAGDGAVALHLEALTCGSRTDETIPAPRAAPPTTTWTEIGPRRRQGVPPPQANAGICFSPRSICTKMKRHSAALSSWPKYSGGVWRGSAPHPARFLPGRGAGQIKLVAPAGAQLFCRGAGRRYRVDEIAGGP